MDNIKILISEDIIQAEIKKMADNLNEIYKNDEVYLICVLKGGVMFAAELAKRLNMPLKMEFVKLSSYGSSKESSGKVDAVDIKLPDLNDKNVIIAEDIIDTGITAKFFIDYINTHFKTKSLKFCSLLNKKIRRKVEIEADYYCFDVDDKFLVGFGLDFDEKFRNLPYIGFI